MARPPKPGAVAESAAFGAQVVAEWHKAKLLPTALLSALWECVQGTLEPISVPTAMLMICAMSLATLFAERFVFASCCMQSCFKP